MKNKINKKGFTLLELLVVVLIIGILAAVALPQYRKVVEEAKLTEALENIAVIEGAAHRYMLAHPEMTSSVFLEDFLDVDLNGGEGKGKSYYFVFSASCNGDGYSISATRQQKDTTNIYVLELDEEDENISRYCYTHYTDIGRYICKYLESQGWEYIDEEY